MCIPKQNKWTSSSTSAVIQQALALTSSDSPFPESPNQKDNTMSKSNEVSKVSSKRKRASSCSSASKESEPSNKKSKSAKNGKPDLTTKGFKRHFAKHNYHDYARTKPSQLDLQNAKASRGGVHSPFPIVLHGMMEECEEKGFSDFIKWQPHGRAFLIQDTKAFVANVLPKYFKHSKLSSFQRQLSLYGFVRLTHEGPDRGAYYHECFLKGRPFLCSKINRTRVKGTWVRTSSSPDAEPDFYTMEPVVDINDIDSQSECSRTAETTPSTCGSDMEDSSFTNDFVEGDTQDFDSNMDAFMINSGDMGVEVSQPAADAGLQPPPSFPTHVISHTVSTEEQRGADSSKNMPLSQSWTPKLPTFDIPSLLDSFTTFPPMLDDTELANFLTDVDLDTDFDTEDVIRITTI